MNSTSTCPICGKSLAPEAPKGLCPECLLKAGFPTGTQSAPGAPESSFVPPAIEELAPKFPELEILELAGRGGMGAVYRARQKQLGRIVALKILPPGAGDRPAFSERFTREARALAALNHPGIVTLYEFGQASGLFYFLMEFVDGVNLRQLLGAERISAREALAIVPQICDALQYAHDHGIVHRDIKPENILLDRRGRVKVADFGVARLMDLEAGTAAAAETASASVTFTEAGKIVGTPQYMAPEQIDDPARVDHRADIYALGVVFYQMLTGELPGSSLEPPSTKIHLDVRLDEVVLRALQKQPERRYQNATVFKTDVEALQKEAAPNPPPRKPEFPASWGIGIATSPAVRTRYVRFWEKLFGSLASDGGIDSLHLSRLGFLGFLAGLAILPGMRWCLPAYGFLGMFSSIGIAYLFETAARRPRENPFPAAAGEDAPPQNNEIPGRWRRRIFWLTVFGIITPIAYFAISLIAVGARGGEKALEQATTQQMVELFATILASSLSTASVLWALLRTWTFLRARRENGDRPANPWPRRVELLTAMATLPPILLVAASIVLSNFALNAPARAGALSPDPAFAAALQPLVILLGLLIVLWALHPLLRAFPDSRRPNT